ncbi:MAG: hypothetical protein JNK26_01490 [Candidatus Doudnabacteria bacterium]|nr:hypothetical protein [Candidatus Doudnabacteria bacterium]
MASDRSIFKFNILQTKSVRQRQIEYERDNSTLYALLLVLFASFVYLAIVITQGTIIEPRRLEALELLGQREDIAQTYADIRSLNGELFIKTRTLRPVLDKNIDAKEIFRVADAIIATKPGLIIESYVREQEGDFVFVVVSSTVTDVPEIIRDTIEIDGVSDVMVRNVFISEETNLVRTTIALTISATDA